MILKVEKRHSVALSLGLYWHKFKSDFKYAKTQNVFHFDFLKINDPGLI